MIVISDISVNHLFHEALSWERTMNYYLQENAFFKTRLAQAIENNMSKDLLDKAEYFQNYFILNDEGMKSLKTDVDILLRQIKDFNSKKELNDKELTEKYRKLNNEINNFTKTFEEIKPAFNQYLLSFL